MIRWREIRRTLLLTLLAWGAVGTLFFVSDYQTLRILQQTQRVPEALFRTVTYFLPWALLSPILAELVRRFPVRVPHRGRNAAILVFCALGIGLLRSLLTVVTFVLLDQAPLPVRQLLEHAIVARWIVEAVIATVTLGIFVAVDIFSEAQARTRAVLTLEADLARAQLQFLKAQLQPHFFFNTLNTIASLIDRQPRAAEKMIADLSDLLRHTLGSMEEQQVPLSRELEFLRRYVSLQKMRFGDRLEVRFDVDPALLGVAVPSMILQPLVENSITHAISSRPEGGTIEIRARAVDGSLLLQVIDDGEGSSPSAGSGIGLTNTAARLRHLHGEGASLQMRNEHDRFVVEVRVPTAVEKAHA